MEANYFTTLQWVLSYIDMNQPWSYMYYSKKQASFNFMAVVTIHSDFEAQENIFCHCFHCFPIYLPWSDETGCYDFHFLNVWGFFFLFIFISWRLITFQYFSGFCHTLSWINHGVTCVPHPDLPSHLPLHPIPLGLPSAPALSTCLMHPTWAGDCFTLDNIHVSMLFSQNIPPSPSPTGSKSLFCTSVSLFLFCI